MLSFNTLGQFLVSAERNVFTCVPAQQLRIQSEISNGLFPDRCKLIASQKKPLVNN